MSSAREQKILRKEQAEPLTPLASDVVQAVRDWANEEIKDATSARPALGRFLFGVAMGTAGLIVALERLNTDPQLDWRLGLSLLLLVAGAVPGLLLAIPRIWEVQGSTDLFVEHKEHVESVRSHVKCWSVMWFVGAAFGVSAVL